MKNRQREAPERSASLPPVSEIASMAHEDASADHGHSKRDEDDSEPIVAGRYPRSVKPPDQPLSRNRISIDQLADCLVTNRRTGQAQ